MEELGVNYGDRHRAFLQALLARGTITFEESKPLLAEIMNAENDGDLIRPEQVTEDEFEEYIQIAGQVASMFDYEVRNTLHQVTQQRIYAFVNTTSDPQTQLATTFAPDELAFVKRVLEAMFDKYNTPRMEVMAITSMQAIKLARPDRRQSQSQPQPTQTQTQVDPDSSQVQAATDRGLKHSEVESIMNDLVGGEWFEKSREGFYSLSARALLELRPWLIAMFNDTEAEADEWQRVKFCEACKEIVTVGLRCKNPGCSLRLHDHCQDAFWRARRSKNCTKCEEEWTGDKYVGERAVTMTQAYQRGRRHGGRGTNLAEEVVQQNQGSEAEEEEADEQDEEDGQEEEK